MDGVPSPNPDYPQDIHVVSGENTIGVNSKNFYNATQNTQTKNSLTYSADNQYIYLNGKASNGFNCDFKQISIPKGTYTMMFELKDGDITTTNDGGLFYVYGSVSTSAQKITNTNKRRAVTFTLNTDGFVYVHVWPRSSETFSNAKISYQLVKGNVADYNFAPYYHADYPINLGSLELCKIGDYQDYLYKENGNWYKSQKVYKHLFQTGHQNLIVTGTNFYIPLTAMEVTPTRAPGYMKSYKYDSRASGFNNMANFYFGFENAGAVHIKNTNYSTGPEITEALINANEVLYYASNVVTPVQITDETLIAQLDAIYNHLALVKGTNHITITPSDLEPYVTLNYMQDLPSKLDNLDSRLALLE